MFVRIRIFRIKGFSGLSNPRYGHGPQSLFREQVRRHLSESGFIGLWDLQDCPTSDMVMDYSRCRGNRHCPPNPDNPLILNNPDSDKCNRRARRRGNKRRPPNPENPLILNNPDSDKCKPPRPASRKQARPPNPENPLILNNPDSDRSNRHARRRGNNRRPPRLSESGFTGLWDLQDCPTPDMI